MKYKKPHISEEKRLLIGAQMLNKRPYGFATDLADEYAVSRTFIYGCLWMLQKLLYLSSGCKLIKKNNIKWVIVVMYLNCESSLEGIRKSIEELYEKKISIGFISGVLKDLGMKLPERDKKVPAILRFVCDEIFLNGKPLLISVDPYSGYILSMVLCEQRDSDSWGYCWLEMLDDDTGKITKIVADLGTGIKGAINELFHITLFQSDLFHYYRKLFPMFSHLESQWIKANDKIDRLIKELIDLPEKILRAQGAERKRLKKEEKEKQAELELAKVQEIKAQINYEDFIAAYSELRECFRFVDGQGNLKSYSQSLAHLEYIIEYLECVDNTKVQQAAAFMKRHKESVLNYFYDVEIVRNNLEILIEDKFIRSVFCLIGYYEHRLGSLQGDAKNKQKDVITDWKQMLIGYLGKTKFNEYYKECSNYFGQIIRSSSMVENVNSRIRRFADASRGQLSQERLNLIRFHLNHKPYQRSEKRKGLSPYQIFYKKEINIDEFEVLKDLIEKGA